MDNQNIEFFEGLYLKARSNLILKGTKWNPLTETDKDIQINCNDLIKIRHKSVFGIFISFNFLMNDIRYSVSADDLKLENFTIDYESTLKNAKTIIIYKDYISINDGRIPLTEKTLKFLKMR